MRLSVFGGTGRTGVQVVRAALDAGHLVTVAARDPAKVRITHPQLRVVRADVLDRPSLDATVGGTDAVVSALGAPGGREPTTVYSAGVANILDAMRVAGVRRFVGVSALPVAPRSEVGLLERLVIFPILYRFFGEIYADMTRMEQLLRHSEVDWTVVRPPRLTDGPPTSRYRTAVNNHLRRGSTISRADLATAILRLVNDPHAIHAAIEIAH